MNHTTKLPTIIALTLLLAVVHAADAKPAKVDRCVNGPSERGGRPVALDLCGSSDNFSEVTIMNPGEESASVSCIFFDDNGVLQFDLGFSRSLPPGGQDFCYSPTLENGSTRTYAWLLIVSSQDVLPTARTFWKTFWGRDNVVHSAQVEAYPVDCDEPGGHEFVCQFAQ